MTSSQYGPYGQGCTRTTMPGTKGSKSVSWSKSQKIILRSDWGLQLDPMKLELLVIAYQHDAVNTFPGLVHTARQAMETRGTRKRCANPDASRGSKRLR